MDTATEIIDGALQSLKAALNPALNSTMETSVTSDTIINYLQLICEIIERDTNPYYLKHLLFENKFDFEELIVIIIRFIHFYSSDEGLLPFHTPECRRAALNFLNNFNYYFSTVQNQENAEEVRARQELSLRFTGYFVSNQGIKEVIELIKVEDNPDTRAVAIETLGSLCHSNDLCLKNAVSEKVIHVLLSRLQTDKWDIVRRWAASVLSFVAKRYAQQFEQADGLKIMLSILKLDPHPNVQADSAEIISILFAELPKLIDDAVDIGLVEILTEVLSQGSDVAVREILRLIEKILSFAPLYVSFIEKFIKTAGYMAVLRLVEEGSEDISRRSIRLIRILVQKAPIRFRLPLMLVGRKHSLNCILSCTREAFISPSADVLESPTLLKRLECALTLAWCCTSDKLCIEYLRNALEISPTDLEAKGSVLIRSLLLLDETSLIDTPLLNVCGYRLNGVGIDELGRGYWTQDKEGNPILQFRDCVRHMFDVVNTVPVPEGLLNDKCVSLEAEEEWQKGITEEEMNYFMKDFDSMTFNLSPSKHKQVDAKLTHNLLLRFLAEAFVTDDETAGSFISKHRHSMKQAAFNPVAYTQASTPLSSKRIVSPLRTNKKPKMSPRPVPSVKANSQRIMNGTMTPTIIKKLEETTISKISSVSKSPKSPKSPELPFSPAGILHRTLDDKAVFATTLPEVKVSLKGVNDDLLEFNFAGTTLTEDELTEIYGRVEEFYRKGDKKLRMIPVRPDTKDQRKTLKTKVHLAKKLKDASIDLWKCVDALGFEYVKQIAAECSETGFLSKDTLTLCGLIAKKKVALFEKNLVEFKKKESESKQIYQKEKTKIMKKNVKRQKEGKEPIADPIHLLIDAEEETKKSISITDVDRNYKKWQREEKERVLEEKVRALEELKQPRKKTYVRPSFEVKMSAADKAKEETKKKKLQQAEEMARLNQKEAENKGDDDDDENDDDEVVAKESKEEEVTVETEITNVNDKDNAVNDPIANVEADDNSFTELKDSE
eukprot:TRINITY_DN3125_c1_g1_i1.p1 TRINITY_DN3125_c1_g1~~TRINITY_DN3125_c1_g1_i1.p1  ORF type:complete len:1005 (-),score=361.82 TRINITY_DN3125_c1_g1_i1:1408-4422(-)